MQRLSGLDASFLYFETRSQLLHVCGLIVLDVSGMEDGYSFEALRTELRRRITAMPPFRRKLHDSLLNVDHPVWVEAEDFDIDHHLHRVGIPEPGGDHELAELCAHLGSQPIDRSMPLWQMYVIEGLPDGRVAVFAKMHHSTVDGVTGANMLSQLCTLSADEPELDEELVEETAGGSGALELAVGGALSRLATPWRLASLLPGTVGVLPSWINRARKGLAMPAPFTAPRTPFNRTITGHRSISYASVDLADIKRVKNAFGTTVNDVVLAVCSTALRKYLDDRDALPRKPLIAMVPMSVHAAESRPGTNRVSGMFMSLATDIDDPVGRLEAIRDANTVAKDHTDALDANLLTDWAQFAAPSVFGSAVRMYSRLRLSERHPVVHNLVISNVPGPNFPLYFLGAKIEKMLPLGPVFHGAGLNCTVMSLDGSLHFGFIGCRDLVPDPWPLANAVEDALAEFVVAAEEREKSGTPTAARKSAGELAQERKEQRSAARQASKESAKSGSKATAVIGRDRASTREATQDESGAGAASRPAAGEAGATTAPAKKAPAKKAPAKKAAAKKAPAKKAPAKQAPVEKVSAEKAPAKKAPAKKAPAKKASATKAPAKKTSARKAPATTSSQQKRAAKPTGSKPAASTPAATTPAATTQTATTQTAAGPDRRTTAPEAPAGPGTPDDAAQAPTYSAPAATVLGDDEISATPTPPIETLPAPDPTGDETSSDTQTGQV
jgi:WS/DGAT/MGAT family acyltransferase